MDSSQDQSAPLLSAKGICISFDGRKVLKNIDLEVRAGRIVTLIGPNGAGKTTLIRIVLGLLQPDSGTITRQPSLRIGYMPQKLQIEPTLPLTILRFLQLARQNDQGQIDSVLNKVKICHLIQSQIQDISGGEMQRVLLARALLRNPDLLILDEPAQGVDLAGQAELYQLIHQLSNEQHCGVLMISHDLRLVMSATDEVICLNQHICCHGKPEQVSNDPAYLDLFGPSAAQNIAVYTHHHNHEHDITGKIIGSKDD
jgi:zinc transport system ATP-binding protein